MLDGEQAQKLLRAYPDPAGEHPLGVERAQAHHVGHVLEARLLEPVAGEVADRALDAPGLGRGLDADRHGRSPPATSPAPSPPPPGRSTRFLRRTNRGRHFTAPR